MYKSPSGYIPSYMRKQREKAELAVKSVSVESTRKERKILNVASFIMSARQKEFRDN